MSYAYNSANQMLTAGARQYGYDANGNLTQESVNGGKAIYGYTADDRVDEVTTNLIDAFAGGLGVGFANFEPNGIESSLWSGTRDVSYRYDPFGRRVSRIASLSLTETQESSAPSSPTHKPRIVYDPVEHRSVIITDDGGMSSTATSTTTTSVNHRDQATQQFLYDGLSFDVLAELNGSSGSDHDDGFGGRMGNTTAEYLKANGVLVERQGLGERSGWWNASYYTQDTLGSTLQMTDPNGQVQTSYAYDAFGTMYQGDLSNGNAYGYTGKRYDPAVGLYDYGLRDYESVLARWMTPDPIRQGDNWFAYCNDDPINSVDLWGLNPSLPRDYTIPSPLPPLIDPKTARAIADSIVQGVSNAVNTVVTVAKIAWALTINNYIPIGNQTNPLGPTNLPPINTGGNGENPNEPPNFKAVGIVAAIEAGAMLGGFVAGTVLGGLTGLNSDDGAPPEPTPAAPAPATDNNPTSPGPTVGKG